MGELKDNSYIPAGLTKAEYDKIRKTEFKKKQENYERNVKKAFQYTDFTKWYEKRGTELSQSWLSKRNTLGHNMAKTKFDWSGVKDTKKFESTNTEKFVQGVFGKKVAAKKKTVPKKKLLTF